MGLAAAKNKRKLAADPNNTRWSRNANLFGQRMMRSKGWEPGQHLGVQGAAHAEWHSQASYAGIRVALKDDHLGLGAKKGSADECTGLLAFSSLLGRLNGKEADEKWEAEQRARADMQRRLHVNKKLGTIEFVKGGWLVGDQVREAEEEEDASDAEKATATPQRAAEVDQIRPSKKRKIRQEDEGGSGSDKPASKTRDKRKKRIDVGVEDDEGKRACGREKKGKTEKKEKKPRRGATCEGEAPEAPKLDNAGLEPAVSSGPVDASTVRTNGGEAGDLESKEARNSRRKKVKEDRKSAKREAKRQRLRDAKGNKSGTSTPSPDETQCEPAIPSTLLSTAESTPAPSGFSTPVLHSVSDRHLSKRRFIAQKRLALVDPAALNQIFMIKSS